MLFILVVLSACAVWNTSTFDLVWIWGTFALAAFITYLVIGSKLLPVEDNRTEQRKATDAFRRSVLGQDQFVALVRDGVNVHETGTPLSSLTSVRGVIVASENTEGYVIVTAEGGDLEEVLVVSEEAAGMIEKTKKKFSPMPGACAMG